MGAFQILRVKASPVTDILPSQTLSQHAPITNTNNPVFAPHFEFKRQVNQTVSSKRQVREYLATPQFEFRETQVEDRVVDLDTGRLIKDRYYGRPEDLPSNLRMVDVVLARFYYAPNPKAEPYVYVSAHISFYSQKDGEQQLEKTVFDAIWSGDEEERSKDFYQARAHDLIVAIIPTVEKRTGLLEFEYGSEKLEGHWGSDVIVAPKHHPIYGQEFLVKIELNPEASE